MQESRDSRAYCPCRGPHFFNPAKEKADLMMHIVSPLRHAMPLTLCRIKQFCGFRLLSDLHMPSMKGFVVQDLIDTQGLGHVNAKQPIQYHLRLKNELEELRSECVSLLKERFQLEQCVRYRQQMSSISGNSGKQMLICIFRAIMSSPFKHWYSSALVRKLAVVRLTLRTMLFSAR